MSLTITAARDDMLKMVRDAHLSGSFLDANLIYDDLIGSIPETELTWARATIRHAGGGQATLSGGLGRQRYTRTGILTIQLFSPSGEGLSSADISAKIFMDAFDGKSSANGVWFRKVRFNEIGPDGNFFNNNIIVEFEYDEIK